MADILRNDLKCPHYLRYGNCSPHVLSVVEFDLPWDESPTSYGDSFNAWTEDTFAQAMGVIGSALPHNDLVNVVSISSLLLIFF